MGVVYSLPDFYQDNNIIKTQSNVLQLSSAQDVFFSKQLSLVKYMPAPSDADKKLINSKVYNQKRKHSKKKRNTRVLPENNPAATTEFNDSEFFQSYVEKMFKED